MKRIFDNLKCIIDSLKCIARFNKVSFLLLPIDHEPAGVLCSTLGQICY